MDIITLLLKNGAGLEDRDIDGSAPFIAPDESYLLFIRFTETGRHLFISFPAAAGSWSEPIDITATVDSSIGGMCPIVSPDEKFFFSIREHNLIYWTDADFLETVRRQHEG